jgi:hypothetical protein
MNSALGLYPAPMVTASVAPSASSSSSSSTSSGSTPKRATFAAAPAPATPSTGASTAPTSILKKSTTDDKDDELDDETKAANLARDMDESRTLTLLELFAHLIPLSITLPKVYASNALLMPPKWPFHVPGKSTTLFFCYACSIVIAPACFNHR